MMKRLQLIFLLWRQEIARHALMVGIPSASLAAIIKVIDLRIPFLDSIMPEKEVFTSFAGTVSILLVFRAMKALNIYKEGVNGLHQIAGCWFNSASTLIAFSRTSKASREDVNEFRNALVRLFSLLNMLCIVDLEGAEDGHFSHSLDFSTIDIEGLDQDTLRHVKESTGKPEIVCQYIQSLIVDNIGNGVLSIPPPILSRSFQELGVGMAKFHETLHLSHLPVPRTLLSVTEFLLLLHALISPFQLAVWTQGALGAACCTFGLVVVFQGINGLASEIEHPFGGDHNDIDTRSLHYDLNVRLLELLKFSLVKGAQTSRGAKQGDSPCLVRHNRRSTDSVAKISPGSQITKLEDLLEDLIAASASVSARFGVRRSSLRTEHSLTSQTHSYDNSFQTHPDDEAFAVPNDTFQLTWQSPPTPRRASDTPPVTPRSLYMVTTPRGAYESTVQHFSEPEQPRIDSRSASPGNVSCLNSAAQQAAANMEFSNA